MQIIVLTIYLKTYPFNKDSSPMKGFKHLAAVRTCFGVMIVPVHEWFHVLCPL